MIIFNAIFIQNIFNNFYEFMMPPGSELCSLLPPPTSLKIFLRPPHPTLEQAKLVRGGGHNPPHPRPKVNQIILNKSKFKLNKSKSILTSPNQLSNFTNIIIFKLAQVYSTNKCKIAHTSFGEDGNLS